jgi:hypothetical protein
MVQFLKDPVFNTSLIVGYYWIPLTILIILYSFIFHAAWLQYHKNISLSRTARPDKLECLSLV